MIEQHPFVFAGLAVLCLVACLCDLRLRRLPNLLCAVTALAGLAQAVAFASAGTPWYWYLLHGAIALLVGMALFAFRWIGGGDAKFYAALACWLPFGTDSVLLITSVCMVGFLLLVVWFVARRLQGKKISMGRSGEDSAKLPFGIAIALGGLLAVATT